MNIHEFTLTDTEREALREEFSHITYDPNGGCAYISELRFIGMRTFPRRILEVLNKQKTSLSPRPYFIINNLPVDEKVHRIPHPNHDLCNFKSGSISENTLLAFSSLIGEPYSIAFEGNEIVNNLIPTIENKKDFTGIGSEVELDFHIENAALKCYPQHNYSPLGLMLTGVQMPKNGPLTRVADARLALELLDPSSLELLKQPLFKIKVPFRWRENLSPYGEQTEATPVILGGQNFPEIAVAFYADMVEPLSLQAKSALTEFHAAIKKVSVSYTVKPGSLIYIDNRFALHSRDTFKPNFDAQGIGNRWIQRVFVAANLWNHRDHVRIKNRVFQPNHLGA
jgi:L-asparagine oxygenase